MIKSNIDSSNGVIHVIDKVLLPAQETSQGPAEFGPSRGGLDLVDQDPGAAGVDPHAAKAAGDRVDALEEVGNLTG